MIEVNSGAFEAIEGKNDVRAIYATTERGSNTGNSSSPKDPDNNQEDGVTPDGYENRTMSGVEEQPQVDEGEEEREPRVEGEQVDSIAEASVRCIVVLCARSDSEYTGD